MSSPALPPEGTVERWAYDFITSTRLADKLTPPDSPTRWAHPSEPLVVMAPGRPPELVPRVKKQKTPNVVLPERRAQVLHTFLHHELQAAELMAWAILAFPSTPPSFRRGLLGICRDEIRHLQLYQAHLQTLGYPFGSFTINDWFWRRVPLGETTPEHFVARMGIAFEGANLDHGARYAAAFEAAGDERAAQIQSQIVEEEVAHTAFALHWFAVFTGGAGFDAWRRCLPSPISPIMARHLPMNVTARLKAGYTPEFLEALSAWDAGPGGKT